MSLKKHLKIVRIESVTCARCYSEYTFTKLDYTVHKTKHEILRVRGWKEFADKAKPYLLCDNCTFSRKYQRLVFTIENLSQIIISSHPFKEITNDHNPDHCEVCLAIQRAILVTNDFKQYLSTVHAFLHNPNPPQKSRFDDSYDFSSDPDMLTLLNSSPLLLDEFEYLQDQLTNKDQQTTSIKFVDFTDDSSDLQTLHNSSLVDQAPLIIKEQESGSLLSEICDNAHDLPLNLNRNIPAQSKTKHNFSISKRVTFSNRALPLNKVSSVLPLPLTSPPTIFRYSLPIIFSLLAIILVWFSRL